MKNPLLLFFFCLCMRLSCQDILSYNYGFSYPEGIFSGLEYRGEEFSSLLQFNFIDENLHIDKFFFKSEYFSCGSISFKGLLKDMNSDKRHLFSFDDPPEAEVYNKGNPRNNMGLIFEFSSFDGGSAFVREDDLSRLFLWTNLPLKDDGLICLAQSLSLDEEDDDDLESWYTEEAVLKSPWQLNSMFTIILGNENLFGGGQFQMNSSPRDSPGYSILFMGGVATEEVDIQNELRYSSPGFATSDLSPYKYPFLVMGKINFLDLPVELDNSYYFYLERENLPWKNTLWEVGTESTVEYAVGLWSLEGELDLSFFNSENKLFLTSFNIASSVRRTPDRFFWQIEGEAGFDVYYIYGLSLRGGYESSQLQIDLSSSVEIGRSITAEISLNGTFKGDHVEIRTNLTLEDIGIYNSDKTSLKPRFFMGLQLESLLNSKP